MDEQSRQEKVVDKREEGSGDKDSQYSGLQ